MSMRDAGDAIGQPQRRPEVERLYRLDQGRPVVVSLLLPQLELKLEGQICLNHVIEV